MTTVRAHARRGSRGVRAYSRPLGLRLYRAVDDPSAERRRWLFLNGGIGGIRAFVDPKEADTIYLGGAVERDITPKEMSKILSHETLHAALFRLGERKASLWLDARRRPTRGKRLRATAVLSPTGLYKFP